MIACDNCGSTHDVRGIAEVHMVCGVCAENPHWRVIARWESKSGKHWVILYSTRLNDNHVGYAYCTSEQAGGYFGKALDTLDNQRAVIEKMAARVNDFQPDANRTPMRRTK